MKVILSTLTEIFGLFVEDGSLAIGIIVWLGVAAFVFPLLPAGGWQAPALFGGLVVLLVENVWRSARRHFAKQKSE
jgi:membrane protein implicated in regulation of membrane protease activity